MKVRELKKILNGLREEDMELEVGIIIWGKYNTEPRVNLKSVYHGFDWGHRFCLDNLRNMAGYLMLVPEQELIMFDEKREKELTELRETCKILSDKKLMKSIRKTRRDGSKSSPYKPLKETEQ